MKHGDIQKHIPQTITKDIIIIFFSFGSSELNIKGSKMFFNLLTINNSTKTATNNIGKNKVIIV
jgi:hypothetical protein